MKLAEQLPSGSGLLGFGAAQPAKVVTGTELGSRFGKSAEWIRTRTGIRELCRLGSDPAELSGLAHRAATDAIASAGLAPADLDLVIVATCSEAPGPWHPRRLVEQVAPRAAWMQLNAACSGFAYAVGTADNLIRTGAARHVLVVAAEEMSRMIDPEDLGTSIIFGDGAGAAVVGPVHGGGTRIGPIVAGSDGSRSDVIRCEPGPRGALRMAGQQVFRWAVEQVPIVAREACKRAGVSLADIDVFVPHQANLRIIEAVTKALGLDRALVAGDVAESGNTSAASIPIALTRLVKQRAVHTGQLALLVGFGAGLAHAAQVVELP